MNLRRSAVAVAVAVVLGGCAGGPTDAAVSPEAQDASSRPAEVSPTSSAATARPQESPTPDAVNPLVTKILSGGMSPDQVADVELSLFDETDCGVFGAWYEQYSGDSNVRVARQAYSECKIVAPSVGTEISRAVVDPEAAMEGHLAMQTDSSVDDEAVVHGLRLARSACTYLRQDPDVEAVARMHWEGGDVGVPEGTSASFVLAARRHLCSDVEIDPHSAPSTGADDLSPGTLKVECSDGMLEFCDLLFAVSPLWSKEADWAQTCSGTRNAPEVPVACSHRSQVPLVFPLNY